MRGEEYSTADSSHGVGGVCSVVTIGVLSSEDIEPSAFCSGEALGHQAARAKGRVAAFGGEEGDIVTTGLQRPRRRVGVGLQAPSEGLPDGELA